ncbi:MAG: hypothetical protein ACJ71H_08545 [Nitrososphaeraceae archaeon]
MKDNALLGSQMCIVTGPRIDLAITFIDRMEKMFANIKGIPAAFDNKETVIELNSVKIEALPSHHLDAMRGLPNVSFILLDKADFFPPGQQADARDVSERYIAKSNPYIVMVSTPNAPEGLFERIEKEAEDTCLYKRIFLDYTYGIGKIYTAEEIERAKQSPSFEREYNLKYLGRIGNVFHTKDIEAAIEKGRKYDPDAFNPNNNISDNDDENQKGVYGGENSFTAYSCYHCDAFHTDSQSDYQRHNVINHPGKGAYSSKAEIEKQGLKAQGKSWEV